MQFLDAGAGLLGGEVVHLAGQLLDLGRELLRAALLGLDQLGELGVLAGTQLVPRALARW